MRRVRQSRQSRGWHDAHHLQLLGGHDHFDEAWGNPPYDDATLADMRACWELHWQELRQEHIARHGITDPPCWAERQFGIPTTTTEFEE